MARVDEEPEDRDQTRLRLPALLDCPTSHCRTTFEWVFVAPEGVYDSQDLSEPPEDEVECPACHTTWVQEYEGWAFHTEAG